MPKQKEAEAPKEAPKKVSKTKASGTWARNYWIRGFGRVNVGEAVTEKAMKAWNARSESKPQLED